MSDIFKTALDNLIKDRDEEDILKKIKQFEDHKKMSFLKNSTPEDYWNASLKNINSRIIDFINNEKRFCWIWGDNGAGKTYCLYAIRNSLIMKGNIFFEIISEYELNYDLNFRNYNAIDNVGMGDNKFKYLSDFYFSIIDWRWKKHKKLFFTSTFSLEQWLSEIYKINPLSSNSISSRLSNQTDVIKLTDKDRRKEKL
jgi:DNA replication protein DnaC